MTPKVIQEENKGALSFRNLFKMFPKRVQNGLKSRFEAFEFSDSDKEEDGGKEKTVMDESSGSQF